MHRSLNIHLGNELKANYAKPFHYRLKRHKESKHKSSQKKQQSEHIFFIQAKNSNEQSNVNISVRLLRDYKNIGGVWAI